MTNILAVARKNQLRLTSLSILAFALLFSLFYLRVHTKWWYSDDPLQYHYVTQLSSPLEVFLDPQTLRSFGTGASIVPMQLLSYWLDIYFFGISPFAAYLHSILSLAIVTFLLYVTFKRYTNDLQISAIVTVLWLALPSTISVHYFIATRHYIEGFGWSLAACYWLHLLCNEESNKKQIGGYTVFIFCSIVAMLTKEIYVPTLLTLIFVYSVAHKRHLISGIAVGLAFSYVGYRYWALGFSATYPVPLLGLREYIHYLAVLPQTFSTNIGGYAVYLGLTICCAAALWQRRSQAYGILFFVVAMMASALLSVYPTAYAVLLTYPTPGTWYRAPFIVNTLVLLLLGYVATRYLPKKVSLVVLLCVLLITIPGTHYTRSHWGVILQRAELEGKFYLNNPNKLLYSEEDSYWFIPGVTSLYDVPEPHYISKHQLQSEHTQQMLQTFPTIWRYEDGSFVEDIELYKAIEEEYQTQ